MKTALKKLGFLFVFLLFSGIAVSQPPPGGPPPPPGQHGQPGNKPPRDTPLGSGLGVLTALGLAYGARKVWNFRGLRDFRDLSDYSDLREKVKKGTKTSIGLA